MMPRILSLADHKRASTVGQPTTWGRRRFLQLSLLSASGVAVGCGTDSPRSSDEPQASEETQSAELVWAASAMVAQFDPYVSTDVIDQAAYYNIFDSMILFQPDGTITPGLAVDWDSIDPYVWTFNLRQGVTWHNGDPFTAEDIEFSLNRVVDPESKSLFVGNFSLVENVETLDEHTVRITTSEPDPFMLFRMGNYGSPVLPKRYFESVGVDRFAQEPVGTGPYKVAEFVPAQRLVLERNSDYWELADVEQITIRAIPESAARMSALRTGEAGLINGVSPDNVPELSAAENVKPITAAIDALFYIVVNLHQPPLNQREVRHALSLAIDRHSINDNLFGGVATIVSEPILPNSIGANPDRPELAYDPDRARSLLAQAGYDGQEILFETLQSQYFGNDQQIAEALVAMWDDVGLNVRMSVLEPAVRAEKKSESAFNGMVTALTLSLFGDAAGLLARNLQPENDWFYYWNVPEISNEIDEYERLRNEAVVDFDENNRAALYEQMSDIVLDVMPWILICQPSVNYGAAQDVDFAPGPGAFINFRAETLSIE